MGRIIFLEDFSVSNDGDSQQHSSEKSRDPVPDTALPSVSHVGRTDSVEQGHEADYASAHQRPDSTSASTGGNFSLRPQVLFPDSSVHKCEGSIRFENAYMLNVFQGND